MIAARPIYLPRLLSVGAQSARKYSHGVPGGEEQHARVRGPRKVALSLVHAEFAAFSSTRLPSLDQVRDVRGYCDEEVIIKYSGADDAHIRLQAQAGCQKARHTTIADERTCGSMAFTMVGEEARASEWGISRAGGAAKRGSHGF